MHPEQHGAAGPQQLHPQLPTYIKQFGPGPPENGGAGKLGGIPGGAIGGLYCVQLQPLQPQQLPPLPADPKLAAG